MLLGLAVAIGSRPRLKLKTCLLLLEIERSKSPCTANSTTSKTNKRATHLFKCVGPRSLVPDHQLQRLDVILRHIQSDYCLLRQSHPSAWAVDSSLLNAEVQARTCHCIPAQALHFHNSLVWAALGCVFLSRRPPYHGFGSALTWQAKQNTRRVCRDVWLKKNKTKHISTVYVQNIELKKLWLRK